ncbi:EcsC family protein [Peribacillus sp. SCS-155]|uniref:EcsC family protein n=1 Tax=Peribacillus sedimenti TaxID=3115297 RepID=UPI0039062F24
MVIPETREYLLNELSVIDNWEKDQKGLWFWDKIGRLPFKMLDKVTPSFIQKKISHLLDEVGSFIQSGGKYLSNDKTILNKLQIQCPDIMVTTVDSAGKVPIACMDTVCEDIQKTNSKLAAFQGATTGIGGLFTLAADIPVLLGLSLKTLQDIAVCYGYDPNNREERIFIIKSLQFATSDIVGKEAILNELALFFNNSSNRKDEVISQLQGWREVVATYRDQFGWKKLLQMVPIAGMVFGAFTNRSMIQDIAETGHMLYKKRRILEKLGEQAQHQENEYN